MFVYFLIYFAIATQGIAELHNISNGEEVKTIPIVDSLIVSLEREQWMEDEAPCLRITLDMLRGVKNNTLWATWVWDSMQPPVGTFYGSRHHIGNYDQCLQLPWSSTHPDLRTQYCIVDVKSQVAMETRKLDAYDSAKKYLQTPNREGRYFNEQSFGVCSFAVCSPSSVAKIYKHLYQQTYLPDGEIYIDPRDCQKADDTLQYSRGFYVFWTVVGILLGTIAVSTFTTKQDREHKSLDIITKSFCMKRNYQALFKINKDEIKTMNGMRVITAILIVYLHEGFYTAQFPLVNGLYIEKVFMNSIMGRSFTHMEVIVDTFLAMSGLLLIRGLMMGRKKNILLTLVKRYIRLIGPLALSTLFVTSVFIYLDHGPYWLRAQRIETDVCKDTWWKNILMINTDLETLCHIVTWYVSCDFQLAVLATFLFYLFRKNRKLGFTAFVVVATAVTLHLGLTVYWKNLPILPFSMTVFFQHRSYTVPNYTYLKSYSRAGSYLVGMAMGYIVAEYNPGRYKNAISQKVSLTTVFAAVLTMTLVLLVGVIFPEQPYDPLVAAVVVATNRVFWAVAVCCFIGVCEYGNLLGPFISVISLLHSLALVTDFLSWSGFVPLSKLSYGLYLLHPLIMQKKLYAVRGAATFNLYSAIINAPGVVVFGYIASLILYLMLEAPLINISNALLTEKSEPEQPGSKQVAYTNGATTENGHTKSKIS